MSIKRILVIDDNAHTLLLVRKALQQAGFEVETTTSAEDAISHIQVKGLPHLAIVDINMAGMSGLEFCEKIQQFSDLPVIMLTAVEKEETIVQAIELYAEDYMTKPFSPNELVARVGRVLRRLGDFAYTLAPVTFVDQNLQVNFSECHAFVGGEQVSLTPTETKLLYILMRNSGQIVTADFLLRRLWPREAAFEDRLRVYVHRLRKKIDLDDSRQYIVSERGIGYRFHSA
ncbi:MAG: response regulator transcription factor [Candidatus Promineifilaceae bacterium]